MHAAALLRILIWEDWPLKFLCFVLAALFWLYVDGELTDEREFLLSAYHDDLRLPEGVELAPKMSWPDLRVRVRGPRRRLHFLSAGNLRVDLQSQLEKPVPGPNLLKFTAQYVPVEGLPGMDVVGVRPNDLAVELRAVYKKTLPVVVQRRGEPRRAFRVANASSTPRELTVRSPQDLQEVSFVWTDPVDVTDKAEDFEARVGIARFVKFREPGREGEPEASRRDLEVEIRCDEKVTVAIQIARDEVPRLLPGVPIQILAPPGAALSVEPRTVNVTVKGAEEELGQLIRDNDLRLYVEWPAEWALKGPPGQTFPARSVQVKAIAPPRVQVRGENDQPLPTVRVRGVLLEPPEKP